MGEDGLVILKGVVPPHLISEAREIFGLRENYISKDRQRFESRSVDVAEIAKDEPDADFDDFVCARPHVLLRKTKYEEIIRPLYTAAMPLVWQVMAEARKDTLLTAALKPGSENEANLPRVYISDIQLIAVHPCAAKKPWTADNGSGGVSVIIPLTSHNKKEHGEHHVLPGSHRLRQGPLGWLHALKQTLVYGGSVEWEPQAGDIVVSDGRTMRRESANHSFTLCEAYLIVRFDWSDKKPPGHNPVTSAAYNLLAGFIDACGIVYKKLP